MTKLILTLTVLLALVATSAKACQFNTDCSVGSQCIKSGYNLYGYCTGGLNPGNSNDTQPATNPFNPRQGNTCSFDTECGPGGSCLKGSYSITGVCR